MLRFTAGRTFDDYMESEMMRAATERQFEIMGEALNGLRRVDPDLAATVPDLPRIIAFRNILIHNYAEIDDSRVWEVVQDHTSEILALVNRLLAEYGPA